MGLGWTVLSLWWAILRFRCAVLRFGWAILSFWWTVLGLWWTILRLWTVCFRFVFWWPVLSLWWTILRLRCTVLVFLRTKMELWLRFRCLISITVSVMMTVTVTRFNLLFLYFLLGLRNNFLLGSFNCYIVARSSRCQSQQSQQSWHQKLSETKFNNRFN